MKRDIFALFAIATIVGIFFFRLFWPEPKLIVTPESLRSDAWHFSFATKYALAQNLKVNRLPLWEPRIGMGFPLFGEGQVGALFLPNIVLLKFINDPVVAYNVTYIVLFLILGWGMYAWLRVIGCSPLASFFGSITITFSGQTIPRLMHHTLLESLSMTPLILTLAHQVLTKKHPFWIGALAIVLSQQIFTGFPQLVFLTILTAGIYSVTIFPWRTTLRLSLAILLGIGLSAIQILPSSEMLGETTSPSGFSPNVATNFSFSLNHMKTFIAPFILGNPRLGTYPLFPTHDGNMFWENNLFIGWLPLAVLLYALMKLCIAMNRMHTVGKITTFTSFRLVRFFGVVAILTFILMFGKESPLYFLYAIWPLNLFRVPSRFAWIFLLIIVTAASWSIQRILNAPLRTVVLILFIIHSGQLFLPWWNYHAIEPANRWLAPSPFIEVLQTTQGAVRTIGEKHLQNNQYINEGWGKNISWYHAMRNALSPNSNLYWGISQTGEYAGRLLKRNSYAESLLDSEIKASPSVATISAQGKRLLDLYHATTIISAVPLDIEKPLPVASTITHENLRITAYRNTDALPRAYLASKTVVAPSISETAQALSDPSFIPGTSVVVHEEGLIIVSSNVDTNQKNGAVEITNETPTHVSMRANVTSDQMILVFGDTYYPGWQATVDGNSTKIFPVNIKERGIRISRGTHDIIWRYQPESFARGLRISIATAILLILGLIGGAYQSAIDWRGKLPHIS